MTVRSALLFAAILIGTILVGAAVPASAHPHVWISARSELVYGTDGKVTAVRHRWSFDEAYSSVASQGLDANQDGTLQPSELAGLASDNAQNLAEYGYFTVLKAGGVKQAFGTPRDVSMAMEGGRLVLSFELPLQAPVLGRTVLLDVVDPTFFIDFETAPGDDAVRLAGAPAGCAVRITRAKQPDGQPISEAAYQALASPTTYGLQFSSRAMAICP